MGSHPPIRPPYLWHLRTRTLALGPRTLLAGIVNLTPDSFSDGGLYTTQQSALDHALKLLDQGADFLDLGGESTRPGAPALTPETISQQQEQHRVLPVLEAILRARPGAIVSVDTYRAATAQAALDAGAEIINDVSGLTWDPAMAATLARARPGVILMHTRGLPSQWSTQPPLATEAVLLTILEGLQQTLRTAATAGIPAEHIVLDPGFGFGKRGRENWTLLAHFADLQALQHPILAGLSRKGFLTADTTMDARDRATHTANTAAILAGAHILRVHDIRHARPAADLADQLLQHTSSDSTH